MSAVNGGWDGPPIVKDGLVLYLDAGSPNSFYSPTAGTTWKDISGNSNNGILVNGPTYNSANGGSIVFDGVDDYCSGSILVPSSLTVNFWFKPLQLRDYNPGIVINTWGDFVWHTTAAGEIYCGTDLNNRFNPSSPGCGIGAVVVNVIHNFTYTYTAGRGTLYKNGNLIVTSNNQLTPTSAGTIQTYFAPYSPSNTNFYIFQIYNRALSASEVNQNFQSTRARFGI